MILGESETVCPDCHISTLREDARWALLERLVEMDELEDRQRFRMLLDAEKAQRQLEDAERIRAERYAAEGRRREQAAINAQASRRRIGPKPTRKTRAQKAIAAERATRRPRAT
jgi:hypothetical protein